MELLYGTGIRVGELVALGLRVYDPRVGRFLSPAPVYQLLDQYTYTMGTPVDFWDPGGRSAGKIASWIASLLSLFGVGGGSDGDVTVTIIICTGERCDVVVKPPPPPPQCTNCDGGDDDGGGDDRSKNKTPIFNS